VGFTLVLKIMGEPHLTPFLLGGAALASLVSGVFALRLGAQGERRWFLVGIAFTGTAVALAMIVLMGNATLLTAGLLVASFTTAAVAVSPFQMFRGASRPALSTSGSGPSPSGERRFRRLVEHAWDAFVLVKADGTISFASASLRRFLGYGAEDVLGRSVFDAVYPEDVAEARVAFHEILKQPGAQSFHEFRATHGDGSVCWLEVTGTNLIDDPSVRAVIVNMRDVTDRKGAEDALARSEEGYRGLVENAIYGVYRSDLAGRFLAVNPALVKMLGYSSKEELLAVDVATEVYVDPAQRQALIERYRDADRIEGVEVEWQRRDGSHLLVWLSGRALRDDRRRLHAFEMIAEDVTERRTLEAQLRQAQKMEAIGQLAGGIAHDFNNLLTVILANADIIEVTVGDGGSPVREEIDDLRQSAQHGRDLVKKLLGYGRRDTLEVRPINLAGLVHDLVPTLKRVLPASIQVRFSASINEAVIEADGGAIQQILFNLATNARDAMDGSGTIHLELGVVRSKAHPALTRWRARGEYVRLAVSDTGHGMNAETKARVFDPFFTTKPPGVGTGLGMAMIYGLVKQQEGFIDIQTEVGQGTTVELLFPRVAGPAETAHSEAAPPIATEGTETILVVEDESAIRRSIKRLLERKGYRVLLAEDGQEALEVFERKQDPIHLVVSDIVMPRMNGFELFKAVCAGGEEVRFLFTSGYATPDIKRQAREASQTFIQKPWDVDDFLRQVRELLDTDGTENATADT